MVRAILIATGYRPEMEPLVLYRPTPLFNIADKPIIFHILEFLVRHGIRQFDLVLNHLPELIEEKLEDGKRWGINITYHLTKTLHEPFKVLTPTVKGWTDEPVILGYADYLPKLTCHFFSQINHVPCLLCNLPDKSWSGWGLFSVQTLAAIPPNTIDSEFPKQFNLNSPSLKVMPYLSAKTLKDLKKSNQIFIRKRHTFNHFPSTARMVEPGIWISRAVSLHPDVKIVAPAFIGEDCQIKSAVEIGPYTIIENNCVIDNSSIIKNSLICQKSYVGEGLEIYDSIVDRNLLINLSHDTKITLHDDFILCELSPPPHLKSCSYRLIEKLLALFLLCLISPFYLFIRLFTPLKREKMLHLPASTEREEWKTFDLLTFNLDRLDPSSWKKHVRRLPALFNILQGHIHFVGNPPRTIKEVETLPHDWQKLYLKSKVGLITQNDVYGGSGSSEDEQYASESFYAIQMSLWYDLKLAMRALIKKFKSVFSQEGL